MPKKKKKLRSKFQPHTDWRSGDFVRWPRGNRGVVLSVSGDTLWVMRHGCLKAEPVEKFLARKA
ncbi:MAG: hypothetical protein ACWGQW_16710 [bacterium]